MIRILILILILWLLKPAELRAEEGWSSLLKNDKESVSHLYTRGELRGASRRVGNSSETAYSALIGALESLQVGGNLCGATFLQEWGNRIKLSAVASDSAALIDYLILWRSENRIDDLFFKIVEEDLAWFGTPEPDSVRLPRILNRDLRRVAEYMKKKNLKPEDLAAVFAPFRGRSPESPGCTLQDYRRLTTTHPDIPSLVTAGRVYRTLDEGMSRLLLNYDRWGLETGGLILEQYLGSLKRVKNREKPSSGASRFLSEKPKGSGGLTRRELLYLRFDPTQIRMLTTVMKRLFTRMDSTRTDLVFTRPDGTTESIPLSPMGQYYFARKLLKRDLEELSRSYFFQGLSPGFEDLLSAALETGMVAPSELDPLLEVDDLWNPKVPQWKRASDLAFRITGSASLFLPPPYNTLTSVVLVLINGIIDRKTRTPSQGDPGYDPF